MVDVCRYSTEMRLYTSERDSFFLKSEIEIKGSSILK